MWWGLGFFVALPLITFAISGPVGVITLFALYGLSIYVIRRINLGPRTVTSSDWTEMPEVKKRRGWKRTQETELDDEDE